MIQNSDSDPDKYVDENDSDSVGLNNLPNMVITSDSSGMNDTDATKWPNEFYEKNYIILNLEYANLNLSSSAVKILKKRTNNSSVWYRPNMLMYFKTSISENCRQNWPN